MYSFVEIVLVIDLIFSLWEINKTIWDSNLLRGWKIWKISVARLMFPSPNSKLIPAIHRYLRIFDICMV